MKLRNKILPFIAACGLVVAGMVAAQSEKETPPAQPVAQPAQAPYKAYIGGAGIVEASTDNIKIGTSIAGIVKTVCVKVGDKVKAGDALFLIDDRELRAELLVKRTDLLKARASVEESKASLEDYRSQYALVRNVTDRRAVSVDEVQQRRNAQLLAEAKVESAKADVASAEAAFRQTECDIERLTVRAPIDCEVLQVNVRSGEYAQTGALDTPLMMLGNLDALHVRVDVDENDAWRFRTGSRAIAFMRGNSDLSTDLAFVRVEPYVTAKTSLTGSSTERVDTRVLQVIYRFDRNALPAYVGQQMDIFIETPETGDAAASVSPGGREATKGGRS
ncbi:MAG: efflux RND transporter periplasmic adaptor subunit [Syntrophobacteraceae bacterium]